MIRTTTTLFCLASLLMSSTGFSPVHQGVKRRAAPLDSAIPLDKDPASLMSQAVDCSTSDTCSIEDAKLYLNEIIDVQSNCASTARNSICDNQQKAAEVVANLRQKISTTVAPATRAAELQSFAVGGATLLVLASQIVAFSHGGDKAILPFQPEEFWWALRDGYLPLMVMHFIRDGGLIQ